ncbi:isochorismatase family protein [Streptomyces sp. NPDC002928]|uniref:isochorismatase family protein n=1 Tax=Streptomyces sp. NPDC002928 TaxID=3154440 RepID=UPI0033A7D125
MQVYDQRGFVMLHGSFDVTSPRLPPRPDDIISPATNGVLPLRISEQDVLAAGRVSYVKSTAGNAVMLPIDHQIGPTEQHARPRVTDHPQGDHYRPGQDGEGPLHSRPAQLVERPVAQGDTLPELKEIVSDEPIYRRTGIINCYKDPTFRKAFDDLIASTRPYRVIISGVTIGTCTAMPTLAMLNDGYRVFPVVDTCGAWNHYEAEAAMSRMARAGAELVTVFAPGL